MTQIKIENPKGAEIIKLKEVPCKVEELINLTSSPSEIDDVTNELGIPAELLNVGIAVPTSLEFLNIGLKNAVYIPRQVSERAGGRKSLYYICKGETIMAGIYTAECGILKRYVTRLSGEGCPAKTGDMYMEELKNIEGRLIYQGVGTLNILNEQKGIGEIKLSQTDTKQFSIGATDETEIWILWSCIKVEDKAFAAIKAKL
ncbi:MAG: hypothetical protein IJK62_14965 [Bacteroidales bacterium]|nr:hypothetical protein [Bacteroidales bacterium]